MAQGLDAGALGKRDGGNLSFYGHITAEGRCQCRYVVGWADHQDCVYTFISKWSGRH